MLSRDQSCRRPSGRFYTDRPFNGVAPIEFEGQLTARSSQTAMSVACEISLQASSKMLNEAPPRGFVENEENSTWLR